MSAYVCVRIYNAGETTLASVHIVSHREAIQLSFVFIRLSFFKKMVVQFFLEIVSHIFFGYVIVSLQDTFCVGTTVLDYYSQSLPQLFPSLCRNPPFCTFGLQTASTLMFSMMSIYPHDTSK